MPIIAGIGAGVSAIQGAQANKRADKAHQAALDFEKQKWARGQAFRDRGTAMLARDVDPHALSALFADPGNPYAAGNTYQPLMRASQVADPPRTARPRDPYAMPPGGMATPRAQPAPMAPTLAPMDAGMAEGMDAGMGDRRAQLAAFAQMLPPQARAMRRGMR